MKILKNKKFIRKCTMAFAGTLLLTTVVQAASVTKKIEASFRNIQMYYNNQHKTMAQEPFIYNGSVYLPVRAVSELVDKNVDWNSATNSVLISDKGGVPSGNLAAELAAKNFEIAKLMGEKDLLEKKVKELEANAKDKDTSTSGDLKKTLAYIEDAFDYEHSIDWEFKLTETSSRINVEVSFDSKYDDRKWDNLSKSQREAFFRDIAREIRADHKNTPINGTVVDSRTGKNIGTFSYSKNNTFTYSDKSSTSFSNLEKDLKRLHSTIKGTGIPVYDIELTGDEDDVTFIVSVDLHSVSLSKEWDNAMKGSASDIRDLMLSITEEIEYDYRNANVQGFVEDLDSRRTIAKWDGRRLQ